MRLPGGDALHVIGDGEGDGEGEGESDGEGDGEFDCEALEDDGWTVNVETTMLSEAVDELAMLCKEFEILDEEVRGDDVAEDKRVVLPIVDVEVFQDDAVMEIRVAAREADDELVEWASVEDEDAALQSPYPF
jgi:hypothetical protein